MLQKSFERPKKNAENNVNKLLSPEDLALDYYETCGKKFKKIDGIVCETFGFEEK